MSQLHQLRGRVGRGEYKSYCVLITDGKSEIGMKKLEIIAGTQDGFKISEEDLRLRGPGDVLGAEQSGVRAMRFASYLADLELIRDTRKAVKDLLMLDPYLSEYEQLRASVL